MKNPFNLVLVQLKNKTFLTVYRIIFRFIMAFIVKHSRCPQIELTPTLSVTLRFKLTDRDNLKNGVSGYQNCPE